jgi:hypothetical protein
MMKLSLKQKIYLNRVRREKASNRRTTITKRKKNSSQWAVSLTGKTADF